MKGPVFSLALSDSKLAAKESILGEGFGTFEGTWRFCDMAQLLVGACFVFWFRLVSDFIILIILSFGGDFVTHDGTKIKSLSDYSLSTRSSSA